MTAQTVIPAWLTRLFPDVHNWQTSGPNRYRGEPAHSDSVRLVVCDPDEQQFRSTAVSAEFRHRHPDAIDLSFRRLEAKLSREMQPIPGLLFGSPCSVNDDGSVTYEIGDRP